MSPLDCVLALTGKYKDTAGVVQAVHRGEDNKVRAVDVEMDIDKTISRFAPDELRVLKAN